MDFDGFARHRASTAAVLEFAWDAGEFRADHVIAALGLTRSTALSALDALIELGLIRELDSTHAGAGYRMGRPARRFELRARAGLVIGIDAGNRLFTAVAADLAGTVVARADVEVPGYYYDGTGIVREGANQEERRSAVFRVIDAVLAEAGAARDDVIGVGVGIPAPVNAKGESPAHPTGFWPHMNAGLREALSEAFPAVRLENDAALAAVAEATLGEARGSDNFVAMLSGRRLGSGVVLEGQLVRGARGGVGELEALTYVADIGGTRGLGDLAELWIRAALRDGRIPDDHPWVRLADEELTAKAVLAHARLSDPVARPLVEELGAKLGVICAVISRFYDPEVIVVCGAVADAVGEVIEVARGYVAEHLELVPRITASALAGDVVSLGAVSAARGAALEIVLPLFTERRSGDGA